MDYEESQLKKPYSERHPSLNGTAAWLRAGILGANDAIVSVSALMVGVAANSSATGTTVLMSGLAGLMAGAMSMAVGEFVSVSSQKDLEEADIELEKREHILNPEGELHELAAIYEKRGVTKETAMRVAIELTKANALGAHAKDELGIIDFTSPKPMQAAFASFLCFLIAGAIPFIAAIIVSIFSTDKWVMISVIWFVAILLLISCGGLAGKIGNSSIFKGAFRVTFGGALALFITMGVGFLSDYLLELLGYESSSVVV